VNTGNGKSCYFWTDIWGRIVDGIAPDVYQLIHPLSRARRTVAEACAESNWMNDVKEPMSIQAFMQVLDFWDELGNFQISPNSEDIWIWKWETDRFFLGQIGTSCSLCY
jgi:hypothetical protein